LRPDNISLNIPIIGLNITKNVKEALESDNALSKIQSYKEFIGFY